MYSYHPAGSIIAKRFQRFGYGVDIDGVTASGTAYVEADYSYDSAGRSTSYGVSYPNISGAPQYGQPVTYTYGVDSMGRPVSLTDSSTRVWAQNVGYDFAGRMTGIQYSTGLANSQSPGSGIWTAETRSYNVNGQLSTLGWGNVFGSGQYTGPTGGIQYLYSATQNNGQITGVVDSISGETVSYQYDALKRLTSSGTTAWSQSYQYDGFGNLIAKVLNGTTTPLAVDANTNRLSGLGYDLNGNMTTGTGVTLAYDEANRVASATLVSGGTEYYGYAPDNKRIYKLKADGTESWTFYGARGEKLVTDLQVQMPNQIYTPQGNPTGQWAFTFGTSGKSSVWFGGRLISEGGSGTAGAVYQDRLGTNRAGGTKFYPYGEEAGTATTNDRTKFGTYNRDGFTGLDYADQRFYASSYGKFTAPDPSMNNVDYDTPSSWNAYSYTIGDPINANDPRGLDTVPLPNPTLGVYNCSSDFIYSAALHGETIQQLFNSNQGVLGVMSYFEQSGSGSLADQKVWAALDWTFENQWNLSASDKNWFYGPGKAPASFVDTVTAGSQVFSGGQLKAGFSTELLSILTGPENSSKCAGLERAFNVAAGVITAAGNLKNGITPIPNPVPGALQFASNGAVPGHGPSVTQKALPSISDGNNVWTFFTDTYTPPPVRRPPPRGPNPL